MPEVTCTIDGCDNTKIMARGWCGPHYKRWYRHGDPLAQVNRRAPANATLTERLEYVGWDETPVREGMTPCWVWRGLRGHDGYGRLWDGTRVTGAHRLAFAAWRDSEIDGVFVLHACDNPPCINPDHLTKGDVQVNADEMVDRGRSANGERKPQHKLTDAQVAEIRERYTGAHGQQAALAREYGVQSSYISVLVRGLARVDPTHEEGRYESHRVRGGSTVL